MDLRSPTLWHMMCRTRWWWWCQWGELWREFSHQGSSHFPHFSPYLLVKWVKCHYWLWIINMYINIYMHTHTLYIERDSYIYIDSHIICIIKSSCSIKGMVGTFPHRGLKDLGPLRTIWGRVDLGKNLIDLENMWVFTIKYHVFHQICRFLPSN